MKKITKSILATSLGVFAITSCTNEEMPAAKEPVSNGAISVSVSADMEDLTLSEDTRASIATVIRLGWAATGDKVFVYDGTKSLGSLNVTLKEGNDQLAYLSGTINAPTAGTTKLTCVYAKGVDAAPAVSAGKVSFSMAQQNTGDLPFVVFGTIDYDGQTTITEQLVNFKFATSVINVNCMGLNTKEGTQVPISYAYLSDVNTTCQLTLSATAEPTVGGSDLGEIRSTGLVGGGEKISYMVSVPYSPSRAGRGVHFFQKTTHMGSSLTSATLDKGRFYNVIYHVNELNYGRSIASINGSEVEVGWVRLWEDGPKFAVYNLGVTDGKQESYGGYYCWGKTKNLDPNNAYCTTTASLVGADDTATALWGLNWRMPTNTELQALLDNCNVGSTTVNGVSGRMFTGKGNYSDYSIFLPTAGYSSSGSVTGGFSDYWSSTPNGADNAYYLSLFSVIGYNTYVVKSDRRSYGYSVRAVLEERDLNITTTNNGTSGMYEDDLGDGGFVVK